MIKGLPIGLLTASLLAACSATPPPVEAPRPPSMVPSEATSCGAARLQSYVGQAYDAELEQAIAARSEAQRVRVIRPGQGYTMDYRPERLNIHLDAQGRIEKLRCG